jgi:diaminopimelate decarboxylase
MSLIHHAAAPDHAMLASRFGTPLWIYDAAVIRRQIARLSRFDVVRYAQKACSNVHILALMRQAGLAVDAVSCGELHRAFAAGYGRADRPDNDFEDLVYTADLIDPATLAEAVRRGVPINAGSLDMLERVGRHAPGHCVWLRINPGFGHGHSNKTNTGGEHSKHGIWQSDVPRAIDIVRRYGLDLAGIHMHIGSGVDYGHLASVCSAMVDTVGRLDHDIRAISAGGGLSVPYRGGEADIDTDHYFELWDAARRQVERRLGHAVRLEIEPGRFLTAQAGKLLCEVHAVKDTPAHRFALVDAGFNDLLRPAMYGGYHEVSLSGPDGGSLEHRPAIPVAIAGPLCEAGDVFTVDANGIVGDRMLPGPQIGDLLLFHDVGAYGAAMSSNYNSRPLAAEVLVDGDDVRLIRRRQTMNELLALELELDGRSSAA